MTAGLGAALLLGGSSRAATEPAGRQAALRSALRRPDTLAYYAARSDMLFGTAIGRELREDDDYAHAVSRECSIVCATQTGPDITRRSRSGFDFRLPDQQVAFAKSNDLAVVGGGHLVWRRTIPSWITPSTDRATALAELRLDVTAPMQHYRGKVGYWVVVNEPIATDSRSQLASCTWLSAIGSEYIALALCAARQADPDAVLVLNEYGIEADHPDDETKRAALLALLRTLRAGNVPVDALGIQAHLRADKAIDARVLGAFLGSVRGLGLDIMVTELDVNDAVLPADISVRDSAVAQTIGDFLRVVLAHRGVKSIAVWGLSDPNSWYNQVPTMHREDGFPSRGTLLDGDLRRKQAYFAVRAAFGGKADRP